MNKDLIEFTESILERYNATPDEWDDFGSAKWSMETTHKISAVFYPQKDEVEAEWENIATGEVVSITFKVTKNQGKDLAKIVTPCVMQNACLKKAR